MINCCKNTYFYSYKQTKYGLFDNNIYFLFQKAMSCAASVDRCSGLPLPWSCHTCLQAVASGVAAGDWRCSQGSQD